MFALLFYLTGLAKAQELIILEEKHDEYFLNNKELEILIDPAEQITIEDIVSKKLSFSPHGSDVFQNNENKDAAYWVRFYVHNQSTSTIPWILESFNYRIDTLEFYFPDSSGNFHKSVLGVDHDFNQRFLLHKNLEFIFQPPLNTIQVYYLRIATHQETSFQFVIRKLTFFTSYALYEYFYLGLFYGMILIIAVYNLFLFFSIRDKAYLFYVMYAISVGIFSLCQDGMGFQFVWPYLPILNYHAYMISLVSMIVFMLLYTISFLPVREYYPSIYKAILWFIVIRIALFAINLAFFPEIKHYLYIDLLPFLFSYLTAILCYQKGFLPARYFILGFTVLFLAFTINFLRIAGLLPSNHFTVYIMNAGGLFEMILLSLALADKIKQLKGKEMMNQFLSDIVKEKKKDMDEFLYKTSHDIRGPLRSIIGLTMLGRKEGDDQSREYFEYIFKTSKKLDNTLSELVQISQMSGKIIKTEEIQFQKILSECINSMKYVKGFSTIRITHSTNSKKSFYSDYITIHSIFQNLIENAIKYQRPISDSYLKISVDSDEREATIVFEDNGIGIIPKHQEKIFDMFYKLAHEKKNSGLGLYLVKISAQKLGGDVTVKSEYDKGSTFTVTLKNLTHTPFTYVKY